LPRRFPKLLQQGRPGERHRIRAEQLASVLRERHNEHPDRPVAVRGDKSVKYREVMTVLSACRAAGFNDVSLIAEREE